MLSNKGFNFIVATNQPGIATKEVSELFLANVHQKITNDLRKLSINILTFYVCKHHWDDSCECRKPKPGMLNQAIKDFNLKRNNLIFIGDENSDLRAAEAAGISGIKFSANDSKFNLSQVSMQTKLI
jgi:D-glycero-D-manno-heptose 1,7-bisphosphate phosphatase